MRKWIIVVLLLSVVTVSGYYLYTQREIEQQIIEEKKGYRLVEKVLSDVEAEQILWINSDLFIKAADVVYKYSEQGELAEEFLQVNQNARIGVKEKQLIICSWENRLIMTPEEFATQISIINSEGEELHFASLHETLKIDDCSDNTITLSNAYPILEEVSKVVDWEGNIVEVEKTHTEISLGGEENIIVYRGDQIITELPLINTVESYSASPYQSEIAFITHTNQVWVIYLSQ